MPKIKGVKDIMYPGENKFKRFRLNIKKKLVIPKNIKKDLSTLLS